MLPVLAEKLKSDPGPHPLKVLKAKVNSRQGANNNSVGDMTVWVQNTSDVMVDKVRVELWLFDDNKRLVGMISEHDLALQLSDDQLAQFVERVYA